MRRIIILPMNDDEKPYYSLANLECVITSTTSKNVLDHGKVRVRCQTANFYLDLNIDERTCISRKLKSSTESPRRFITCMYVVVVYSVRSL